MDSLPNDSALARSLLASATLEPDRLRRHLLVAAALRHALRDDPIVVGGLAEDYYTSDSYLPTDLDVCAELCQQDIHELEDLGFRRDGRHWYHSPSRVAVEFADTEIDGEESRTREVEIGSGRARLIGIEDLYLDRVRQATMDESDGSIPFTGAVAIAATCFEEVDWTYVRIRLKQILGTEPVVGGSMLRIERRIRRRARQAIT